METQCISSGTEAEVLIVIEKKFVLQNVVCVSEREREREICGKSFSFALLLSFGTTFT